METIRVGISDLNITSSPNRIRTNGLGSCVGIIMYDKVKKIGGLSHIMLPSSMESRTTSQKEKFADTAIPLLLEKMLSKGAKKTNISCGIFGGANMFNIGKSNPMLKIGDRNIKSTKEQLKKLNIPIQFEDLGGNKGRTIELDCETGTVSLRVISCKEEFFRF